MKMTRTKIACIAIELSVLVFIVLGLLFSRGSHEWLLETWMKYRETNSQELIAHLEGQYSTSFPKEIDDVRAAKTFNSWDGPGSFILKFTISNDDIESLYSVGDAGTFMPYSEELDWRLKSNDYPDWYVTAINNGDIFGLRVTSKDMPKASYSFKVYLDTSSENNSIIYMSGSL